MPITPASGMTTLKILETHTPLDKASGIGGLPRGFIVELWGKTNSGKSTIAFQTVAAAQKQGLRCLWIDIEHSFRAYIANPRRIASFGVDMDKLDVMLEANAEDYINNTEDAIRSKKYDVIIMDSVGDLSSKIEQEKSAGEKTIGTQASLMTKFVRTITWMVDMNEILFIVVNHERQTLMGGIYQMGGNKLAEKKKMSFRFREKQNFMIKVGEKIVGKVMRINVSKNHFAATEGMEIESNLLFQDGFDFQADLLDEAIARGLFDRKGNTFWWGLEKLGMIGALRERVKTDEIFSEKLRDALHV